MLKYSEVPDTEVSASPMVERCLVVAAKVESIITKAALSHLYYFTLLIRAWYSNELPELEVANSRRTSVAPDRRQAMLMPRSGLRRRVSLV